MCIAAIAWQLFDELPLVILSNRDEFLQRPPHRHQWSDLPIYAGRDDQSGGTWLGMHQQPLQPEQLNHSESSNYSDKIFSQNGRWAQY